MLDENPDEAFRLCNDRLREHPEDSGALFVVGVLNARADRHSIALPVFERLTRISPNREEGWNNYGMSLVESGRPIEARDAFQRALSLKAKPAFMANIAVTYLNEGKYEQAKRWCRKALEIDPEHSGAWGTLGFASLATGDWETGWKGYDYCLGGRFRKEVKFGDEPKWDGSPVESLVIYGEQGIGDEIMYASCIPDTFSRAQAVALECDPRLEGLFRRSFPSVEVHGTRRTEATWAEGRAFSARCATGSLPGFFRPTPASCPKAPYLIADPERRLQWRALFDSWGKPVVGLAWSGGRAVTQAKDRAVGLESFRGLIERTDAVFVSLEYKDVTAEIEASGLPVKHIPRAVQSPDYDDTAAFVMEMDRIIGPPTAVHHLAGALGKPSTVLVPDANLWTVAHGDRRAWYAEQPYHRKRSGETWAQCINRL